MMVKAAFLLVVLVALSGVYAGKKGGRRGGNRGARRDKNLPPGATRIAEWQRALNSSVQAKELGYYTGEASSPSIFIKSKDYRNLKKLNYAPSTTLYDFTGGESVVVIKMKKVRSCIKLNKPTNLDSAAIIQQITALDNTVVQATPPVSLFTTTLDENVVSQLRNRTAVRSLCGAKTIKGVTDVPPATAPGVESVRTATLDEELLITDTPGTGGGRRRGGGGGGRHRGGGGRRREGRRNNSPSL